jgi:hypothetical protein
MIGVLVTFTQTDEFDRSTHTWTYWSWSTTPATDSFRGAACALSAGLESGPW